MDMVQVVGSIKDALKEVEKNYKSVILNAVQKSSDMALRDIYNFSMSVIDRYYANYDPNIYHRDYDLYDALVPINQVKDKGNAVQFVVGVGFDGDAVGGKIGSNKWGTADGVWIIKNFLQGVHPTTNGATIPEYVEYIEITDSISPNSLLQRYFGLYKTKLRNEIIKHVVLYAASKL